ncbi:MAG: adenine phosphoribosyltransferase [Desulfotalea sp.]
MDLKQTVRSIKDWPIEGVVFRDLTTLMSEPKALKESCDILYERYKNLKVDKVVGLDARGFVFGGILAYLLGVAFIPVRKKGKLPPETLEQEYNLEYGSGTLEIKQDAIDVGDRVLIIDDLIATGGTAWAAVKLVEQLGGEILECGFIIELPDLKGRELIPHCKIFSVMEFAGE